MADSESFQTLRKLLPYTTLLVVIAAVYVGWTLWSRREENRRIEAAAQAQEIQRDAQVTRMLGDRVKIMGFYASPGTVRRGEKVLVCYSVANAKTVRIEPRIEDDLKPSLSRCLEIHPKANTKYTLAAEDAQGHREVQSFVITVAK